MPRDLSTLLPPPLENSTCTECGAVVPPEFASCDELFMSILRPLGMEGADSPQAAALARLLVDAFAMQHPARSCKSAKSYAAHLTGLCSGVEYNGSQSVYAALQRWLSRRVEDIGITRPTEPEQRGKLTIRYIYGAPTPEERAARLHEWAQELWSAYWSQQDLARDWIRRATRQGRRT